MSEQDATLNKFTDSDSGERVPDEEELARKTVCGIPPDDWSASRLREVVEIVSGNSLPADHQDETEGDHPVYKVSDMNETGNQKYLSVSENWLSEDELEELNHTLYPEQTIVLPKVGAALLTNKRRVLTESSSFDNNVMGWVPDALHPEFLYYVSCMVDMEAVAQKGAVPSISKAIAESLKVPSPPLEEQRKIASVLYNVDQAIHKTEKIIEQTERVRRGFIRERVTAQNSNSERIEGIIGTRRVTIPEHWSIVRLGDVGEIVSGKSFPREYQDGHAGERAVIKVEDMNLPGNDKYVKSVTNRVTDDVIDELNKNIFPADTIIHPRVGEALLLNKTRITTEDAAFDDNIMGWIPEGINPEYLYYAATMIDFNAVAQTGTVPSINKEMAANFRFPLPPEEEQTEIVEDLSRVDGQISIYEQEKKQLQRLKQGLMQDLLSGEVRTHDTDIEIVDDVLQHG